ncbi:MAG: hypothetical protein OXH99_13025 [Bryobacterales bacterium]|nr:hypothetical protein [Bryobacterales bacterium]
MVFVLSALGSFPRATNATSGGVLGVEMSVEFHLRDLKEVIDECLEGRNEFWELFGRVTLSIVVVLLAGLLMMNKIEADAGLPILSAIVCVRCGQRGWGFRSSRFR